MINKSQSEFLRLHESPVAPLDLVIPVTTPELTRACIFAAEHLAGGLGAEIRLLRIQIVPFPLQLASPPVPLEFLQQQLESYDSDLPLKRDLRLARDFEPTLLSALSPGSIVILCAKKRPWRTGNERLAETLRRAGHSVILTFKGANHA